MALTKIALVGIAIVALLGVAENQHRFERAGVSRAGAARCP